MTKMLKNRIILYAAGLLCAAAHAAGQAPANPDSALQVILGSITGTPLRLRQAVDAALSNATGVREAEAAYLAAGGAVRRESGLFDPLLFSSLTYVDQSVATASFFSGAPVLSTLQTTSRTGVRMDLPVGTKIELALTTVRLATNSQFAFLNPEYDAFGSLSLRQPLLGGFMVSARKHLAASERDLDAAKARYDQQVLATGADAERSYWDLYAAERDYAVQKLTRDRAEAFLKETELRARTGLVGPNQVASAKTFLAEQELFLLEREEQLDGQSDRLGSLIGIRPEPAMQRFLPLDAPPEDFALDSSDVLVRRALANNLDLQASQRDVEAARVRADAAGWEALPSVNLFGSLGGSGLTGNAQDVIFQNDTLRTTRIGNLGDAVNQVRRRDFPNWSIGVEVAIPIGLRSGLGEKDRLNAELVRAEQRYLERSHTLEEQVRAAGREVANGRRRIGAARTGVDAAREQVRIGLIEFHNGRSTAFELVHLGEDLALAERRFSEALVRTAKAAATLRQLAGPPPER